MPRIYHKDENAKKKKTEEKRRTEKSTNGSEREQ